MLLALSVSAGAVVFVGLLLAALFRSLDPALVRDDYVPCAGGWSEAILAECASGLVRLPQQPVNTYTNLAYVAAGLFPGVLLDTPAAYAFAFTMGYLGVSSALYHALSTRWAGRLDVTAIYVVYAGLATYAAAGLFGLAPWLVPGVMLAVAGVAAYVLSPGYVRDMEVKIALFLGATYLLVLLTMWQTDGWGRWPLVVGSLGVFAGAFLSWVLDVRGAFPLRRWGHGLWHLLTAAATALLFYAVHVLAFA